MSIEVLTLLLIGCILFCFALGAPVGLALGGIARSSLALRDARSAILDLAGRDESQQPTMMPHRTHGY